MILLFQLESRAADRGFVDLAGGRAVDVSVGSYGACAVTDAGRVFCWGDEGGVTNDRGRRPAPRSDVSDAERVFLTATGGCIARRQGPLVCWGMVSGSSVDHLLGGGLSESPRSFSMGGDHGCGIVKGGVQCWGAPSLRVPVRDAVQVAAGPFADCARDRRGGVWCWDRTTARGQPNRLMRVSGLGPATHLSVASGHACAVVRDGSVDCWNVPFGSSPSVARVRGLESAVAVSAAANHNCAVRRGGDVSCWGLDGLARPVPGLHDVAQLESGFSNTCARLGNGNVICLGPNLHGELGIETPTESAFPIRVPGLDAVGIAAEHDRTCAIRRDGGLSCWGAGRLVVGAPIAPEALRPREVPGAHDLVQVIVTNQAPCAVSRAGKVSCWNSELDAPSPPVAALERATVRFISPRGTGLCAVTAGGAVLCPELIEAARGAVQAVGGGRRSFGCALLPTGQVVCWGPGMHHSAPRQLDGTDDLRSPAVNSSPLVLHLPPVRQIVGGLCAVFASGRVSCGSPADWADTSPGLLTDAPVDGARLLALGNGHSCAILASGQVACWGANHRGQLGLGTIGAWPPPTPLPRAQPISGLEKIVALAAGADHACAVRSDGAVFCWGGNELGQLGNGTIGFRSTP